MLKVTSFLFFFFTLFSASQLRAEFQVPEISSPVIDQVGIMTWSDRSELEKQLRLLNSQGKVQIQVLIVGSLGGDPIESASIKAVDKWKLGDVKKDNGVLFLIAPNEKKMRIEVGQGLEGVLPDIQSKRILSDEVTPYFRAKRFSAGVVQGVSLIIQATDKEFAEKNLKENSIADIFVWLLRHPELLIFSIWIILVFIKIFFGVGGGRGGGYYGGGWGSGTGWGGSSGGSGSGGSWSGGGGGFSGGGASSDW